MPTYSITPLKLGSITRPKSNMILGYEGDEKLDFPLVSYFLDGPVKVLVDTGGSPLDSFWGRKAAPYHKSPDEELGKALMNIGVSPDDIELVILTHLHWDHAASNHLFPNAHFMCQRLEYEFIINPTAELSVGYDFDTARATKYELIDGDAEVIPGISALLTPGHTVGMQSLVVDTKDGPVVMTGDLITLRESVMRTPPVPNGLFFDQDAMFAGMKKVLAVTNRILPGHDGSVFSEGMGL